MAKEGGLNCVFQASAGSPSSYVSLDGQRSTTFTGEGVNANTTDKNQQGWGSTQNVLRRGTVQIEGQPVWGDTILETIRSAWENGTDVDGQIVFDSAGKKYTGNWQVTAFDISADAEDITSYSITLQNNGALVYAAT